MQVNEVNRNMETLQTILLVAQVLIALSLIGLILVQHGKGADAGAAFGSGASNTVFGSQGSGNFLTRTTAILAFTFLVNSLALAYLANERVRTTGTSVMEQPAGVIQSVDEQPSSVISEIPGEPEVIEVPLIPE
jgi:preprotein translocase subunit SecG